MAFSDHYQASDGTTYNLTWDTEPSQDAIRQARAGLESQIDAKRQRAQAAFAADSTAGRFSSYEGAGARGFIAPLASMTRGVGEAAGIPTLIRGGDDLDQRTAENFPVNPQYGQDAVGKVIGSTGGLAGAALPFLIPGAGEVAGPLSLLPQSFDSGYQRAAAAGLPASQVGDYATTNALIQAPIMIAGGRILRSTIAGPLTGASANPLAELGVNSLEAGGIGASSRFASNVLEGRHGYNIDPNRGLTDDVASEGALMAAGAGILGLPRTALRYALPPATPPAAATTTAPADAASGFTPEQIARFNALNGGTMPGSTAADPVAGGSADPAADPAPAPIPLPTQPSFLPPLSGKSAADSASFLEGVTPTDAELTRQLYSADEQATNTRAAADRSVNVMDRVRASVEAQAERQRQQAIAEGLADPAPPPDDPQPAPKSAADSAGVMVEAEAARTAEEEAAHTDAARANAAELLRHRLAQEQQLKDSQVAGAVQQAATTAATADPVAPATADALRQVAEAKLAEHTEPVVTPAESVTAPEPVVVPPAPLPLPPADSGKPAPSNESATPAVEAPVSPTPPVPAEAPATAAADTASPVAPTAGERPASQGTPGNESAPPASEVAGAGQDRSTAQAEGTANGSGGPLVEATAAPENGQWQQVADRANGLRGTSQPTKPVAPSSLESLQFNTLGKIRERVGNVTPDTAKDVFAKVEKIVENSKVISSVSDRISQRGDALERFVNSYGSDLTNEPVPTPAAPEGGQSLRVSREDFRAEHEQRGLPGDADAIFDAGVAAGTIAPLDAQGRAITRINSDPTEAMRASGDVQADDQPIDELTGGVKPEEAVRETAAKPETYGSRTHDDYFNLPQERGRVEEKDGSVTPSYVDEIAALPKVKGEDEMLVKAHELFEKRRNEINNKVSGYENRGGVDGTSRVMTAALLKYQRNLREGKSGQNGYDPREPGQILSKMITDFQKGASKRKVNVALDAPAGEEGSARVGDLVPDDSAPNPAEHAAISDAAQKLDRVKQNYFQRLEPADRAGLENVFERIAAGELPHEMSADDIELWDNFNEYADAEFKDPSPGKARTGEQPPSELPPAAQSDAPPANEEAGGRGEAAREQSAGDPERGTEVQPQPSGDPTPADRQDTSGVETGESAAGPEWGSGDRVTHDRRAAQVRSIDGDTATIRYKGSAKDVRVPTSELSPPSRSRFRLGPRADGNDDILSSIVDQGGIESRTQFEKRTGQPYTGGEYNDAPELKGVHNASVYGGSLSPDRMAEQLATDHPEILDADGRADVNKMWEALSKAIQSRGQAQEDATRGKVLEGQFNRFARDTAEKRGEKEIPAQRLTEGSTVKVGGETMKVVKVDPKTGEVTLQDGRKYGRQQIGRNESIWVEKFRKGPKNSGVYDDPWAMPDEPTNPASDSARAGDNPDAVRSTSPASSDEDIPRGTPPGEEGSLPPPEADRSAQTANQRTGSEVETPPAAPESQASEDGRLPRLRDKENQGDLLSNQVEDLNLVGEKGIDHAARQAESERLAREDADNRARQERDQMALPGTEDEPAAPARTPLSPADSTHLDRSLDEASGTFERLGVEVREDADAANGLAVAFDPDTNGLVLKVNRSALAENMARNQDILTDPAARRAFIEKAMGEEVEHAAQIAEAYDRYKASGSDKDFADWFHNDQVNLLNSINEDAAQISPKNQAIVGGALLDGWNLYFGGDPNIAPISAEEALSRVAADPNDTNFRFANTSELMKFFQGNPEQVGPYMMETMRMLNQIRATDGRVTTETAFISMVKKFRAYIDQVLTRLRRVAADPKAFSPALADALRRVQAVRDGRAMPRTPPIEARGAGGRGVEAGVAPVRTRAIPPGATAADIERQAHDEIDSRVGARGGAVKQFVDTEIKGRLAEGLNTAVGAMREIRNLVVPGAAGSDARRSGESLRSNLGNLAANDARARAGLESASRAMEKLGLDTAAGQKASLTIQTKFEKGGRQATPELQSLSDSLRSALDDRYAKLNSRGLLKSFITDYLPHIWKTPEAASKTIGEILGRRPLEGRQGFKQERSIDFVVDGVAQGLEPVTWNPVEATLLRLHEMDRCLMAHDLVDDLQGKGLAQPLATEGDQNTWTVVRAKMARGNALTAEQQRVYDRYSPTHPLTGRLTTDPDPGNVAVRLAGQSYQMPADAARPINNYLSPGLRGNALYDALRYSGNLMNAAQLGASAFHLGFVSVDSTASKMSLGLMQVARGMRGMNPAKLGEGVGNIVKASIPFYAPVEAFLKGSKVLREYTNPGSVGGIYTGIADQLQAAGARAGMESFYDTGAVKSFRDAISKGNYFGAVLRAPMAAVDFLPRLIGSEVVPRFKLAAFFDLAREEVNNLGPGASLEKRTASLQKAWDSIDNRLGQVVYDNLHWNKTLKDSLMLTTRSVGWNLGTIRELGGGVLDTATVMRRIKNGDPVLTSRMAYIAGMTMTGAMLGSMIHYLYNGKGPEELKDYFFPRTGKLNKDGSPERLQLPSYLKDVLAYKNAPLRTLIDKQSPLISALASMYQNKDFYGNEIRNGDDPLVQQVGQEASFIGKQFVPFQVTNFRQRQGKDALTLAENFVGVTPAPAKITRSPAVNAMTDIMARHMPSVGRTPQEQQQAQMRKELMSNASSGQNIQQQLRDAVASKQMTPQAAQKLLVDSKVDPSLRMFRTLGVEDARRVFDLATPAEKQMFITPLRAKEAKAQLPLSALAMSR